MADLQILATGVAAAPSDVVIPDSAEIQPKSVRASFDGSGAGGPFLPTLVLISDANHEAWRIPTDVPVQAGDSAEVSWAPFLDGRPPGLPYWTDILAGLSLNYGTIKTDVGNSYAYATVQALADFATVLVWLRITLSDNGGPSAQVYQLVGLPPALQIPDLTPTQVTASGISNTSGTSEPDSDVPVFIDSQGFLHPQRATDPTICANNYADFACIFSGFGVYPYHTN